MQSEVKKESRYQRVTRQRLEYAKKLEALDTSADSLINFATYTYPLYRPSWFHKLIAKYLEDLTLGFIKENLMIFAPPQHGKSELVCVRRPAWTLGKFPDRHFILTAYGDALANQFSKAVRNTLELPSFQRLYPLELKYRGDTTWAVKRENDDQRPSFVASGIMSAITGIGATDLLVDDPVKNAEEAYSIVYRNKVFDNYRTAAGTRMAEHGRKCLVMTRWHEDDLAGRLLKLAQEDKKSDQWIVISLAATNDAGEDSFIWNTRTGDKQFLKPYEALWPEAKSRDFLDQAKANIGSVYWEAMYMQRPSAPQGSLFKRANWTYYDKRPQVDQTVQIYDCATEEGDANDFSASITLGCGPTGYPIFDAWRDKLSFPFLVRAVYERWFEHSRLYGFFPSRVLVEDKSAGRQLLQQLDTNNHAGAWMFPFDASTGEIAHPSWSEKNPKNGLYRVPVIPFLAMPAQQSKVLRAQGIIGYHEARTMGLPRGADWVADFVDSHALFPKGPHDDWEDCTVHGMTYFHAPLEIPKEVIIVDETRTFDATLEEFDMGFSQWG
jgi:hypothetical protein